MSVQPCGYCAGGYRYELGVLRSCSRCNGSGYINTPDSSTGGVNRGASQPLYPWIDQLVELIPTWVHWVCAIITGIAGYSYGVSHGYQGQDLIWPSVLGMVAWPIGIAMLVQLIKFALLALKLLVFAGAAYAVWWVWNLFWNWFVSS